MKRRKTSNGGDMNRIHRVRAEGCGVVSLLVSRKRSLDCVTIHSEDDRSRRSLFVTVYWLVDAHFVCRPGLSFVQCGSYIGQTWKRGNRKL